MRVALLMLCLTPSLVDAQQSSTTTLPDAVREALERSPELAAAGRRAEEAALSEPLLLANTDPSFKTAISYTDDTSPRSSPLFQGSRSRLERWEAGFSQKTLLGTDARLIFRNERLMNPTPFRPLDPSIDSRLNLEVTQPLLRYFWGRPDTARRRRARAEVAVFQARLTHARESLGAAAARAYIGLHFARGQTLIKTEGVAAAETLLAKYQEKRRYGLVEASDVLQAEASLELSRTELLQAEGQAERATTALLSILKRPEGAVDLVLTPPAGVPEVAEDVSAALARRGDVRAARSWGESLEWASRIETLDTLPDLALSASYGTAGLASAYGRAWDDLGKFDHAVKSAGLSLNIPLGFRRERLTRKAARLRAQAARDELEASETAARKELRDAAQDLLLARRRLEVGRRLAGLEERKLAAEQDNFKRGRSTTDLLLRFLQDVRRSRSELLRAEMDAALAQIEMARASGRLLEGLGMTP